MQHERLLTTSLCSAETTNGFLSIYMVTLNPSERAPGERARSLLPLLLSAGSPSLSQTSPAHLLPARMPAGQRTLLASLRAASCPQRPPRPSLAPARAVPTAPQHRALASAVDTRRGWTREQVQEVYDSPLMDLIFRAVRPLPFASGIPTTAPRISPRTAVSSRADSRPPGRSHAGLGPPPQPPARPGPALHAPQHQDRRLLRGLLVLRPVVQVRGQGRPQG